MSFVKALIEEYVPQEKEFTVSLPGGQSMRFAVVKSYSELQRLKTDGAKFIKSIRKGACPADMKEFMPEPGEAGDELAMACFSISRTIIEPKLGVYELFELAAKAPFVFEHIRTKVDEGQIVKRAEADSEELEEAKKESPVALAGETDS